MHVKFRRYKLKHRKCTFFSLLENSTYNARTEDQITEQRVTILPKSVYVLTHFKSTTFLNLLSTELKIVRFYLPPLSSLPSLFSLFYFSTITLNSSRRCVEIHVREIAINKANLFAWFFHLVERSLSLLFPLLHQADDSRCIIWSGGTQRISEWSEKGLHEYE